MSGVQVVTAPTYETCRACGSWQRVDLLGPICTSCHKPLVAAFVVVEHQADVPASPILSRKVFRSASLRDSTRACPPLKP